MSFYRLVGLKIYVREQTWYFWNFEKNFEVGQLHPSKCPFQANRGHIYISDMCLSAHRLSELGPTSKFFFWRISPLSLVYSSVIKRRWNIFQNEIFGPIFSKFLLLYEKRAKIPQIWSRCGTGGVSQWVFVASRDSKYMLEPYAYSL